MKKVGFAAGEVALLSLLLPSLGRLLTTSEMFTLSSKDVKKYLAAGERIADKLAKAQLTTNEPSVNAPALEEALIAYSRGKVVPLANPIWPRYSRQAALAGATLQDAQVVGEWLYRQGWVQLKSQTLESVLRNWASWLGKARAGMTSSREAGFSGATAGDVGQGPDPQRQELATGRRASGFGRKAK